jgi:ERCC4-type nuclease
MIVDTRERDLIDYLTKAEVKFTVKQLDIADIIFENEDKNTNIHIERKTISDLKSSICDGRLREQKARMMNNDSINTEYITYIIEGKIPVMSSRVNNNSLLGSMINIMFRDDLNIYRTYNLTETGIFLIRLHEKLNDNSLMLTSTGVIDVTVKNYSSYIKIKKSDNITPKVCYTKYLAIIPRVSHVIAEAIVERYSTLRELIDAFDACEDTKAREELLVDIKYKGTGEKERRIGPVLAKRIASFVF